MIVLRAQMALSAMSYMGQNFSSTEIGMRVLLTLPRLCRVDYELFTSMDSPFGEW